MYHDEDGFEFSDYEEEEIDADCLQLSSQSELIGDDCDIKPFKVIPFCDLVDIQQEKVDKVHEVLVQDPTQKKKKKIDSVLLCLK